MGLKFCKYTKIQQLQEAHRAQVSDDVHINMIAMEEVFHFHQQAKPFHLQRLTKPLPQHLNFHQLDEPFHFYL
jgi:hypothetical protein